MITHTGSRRSEIRMNQVIRRKKRWERW